VAEHRVDARVLITLYPGRALFVKAVVEEIRRHLGGQVFETVVRYSVKLGEAASHGLPIVHYCRRSAGFDDYQALAAEVLRQEVESLGVPADVDAEALRAIRPDSVLVPDGIAAD
jgi:cellulose biosynthesis protein BcsQ